MDPDLIFPSNMRSLQAIAARGRDLRKALVGEVIVQLSIPCDWPNDGVYKIFDILPCGIVIIQMRYVKAGVLARSTKHFVGEIFIDKSFDHEHATIREKEGLTHQGCKALFALASGSIQEETAPLAAEVRTPVKSSRSSEMLEKGAGQVAKGVSQKQAPLAVSPDAHQGRA